MSNGAMAVAGPTYYVDASNGDDTRTDLEAQNPAMPWRTIKKALDTGGLATTVKQGMPSGYTVIVKPGVYNESVEPKRDGFPDAQVIIQASSPGSITIAPHRRPTASPSATTITSWTGLSSPGPSTG